VGDRLFTGNAFRTGASGLPGPLDKLAVIGVGNRPDGVYFDDFILDDSAENLNVALVPEPATLSLALLAGWICLLARKRRLL